MPGLLKKPALGPVTIEPRPHQAQGIAAVRDEFLKGIRRTMICHATGTGKGPVIGMVGRMTIEKGGRVLALAHTDELVQQLADTFDMVGVEPGIEKGGQFARAIFDDEPDAVVGSVMTMKESGRLQSFREDYFNLICIDECHHSVSPSYKKILSRFPKARVLGLTATPKRGDDVSLGGIFQSVAHTFSILDAWEAEQRTGVQYLSDIVPVKLGLDIDLRKLRPQKGDFTDRDLDERVAPMIDILCNKVAEKVGDRQTLAFFPSIRSAQLFAKGMCDLGFAAEAVWGGDPDRQAKVERYRKGQTRILSNMQLLTEGYNVPDTSAIVLGRPTRSWSLYLQMVGRGTRAGKKDCLVLDPGYLTDQFDLVQPTDLIDVPGFDREIAQLAAEMIREAPGLSLRNAIEQARDEHERRAARKQYAIRISVAGRKVDCPEESYSMRQAHADGEVREGTVPLAMDAFKPATPGQIAFLKALGVDGCDRWSRPRAGATISYLKRQRDAGKSHLWQRKKLIRKGVDAAAAREMSADQATATLEGFQ